MTRVLDTDDETVTQAALRGLGRVQPARRAAASGAGRRHVRAEQRPQLPHHRVVPDRRPGVGVNQWLQYRQVGRWRDYLFGERAYIVLSLVTKSLLAWQIFANVLRS